MTVCGGVQYLSPVLGDGHVRGLDVGGREKGFVPGSSTDQVGLRVQFLAIGNVWVGEQSPSNRGVGE